MSAPGLERVVRVATWNLENLDDRKGAAPLEARIAVLRPRLLALRADILCLQEVGAQRLQAGQPRRLAMLEQLLAGTPYEPFNVIAAGHPNGQLNDVHNLVVLSRYPIRTWRCVANTLVPPVPVQLTSVPTGTLDRVEWDRPLLHAELELSPAQVLHVLAVHLRAPLATYLPGQKWNAASWRSTSAWAEGFWLSSVKRTGQALEARLLVDQLLSVDSEAMVVVAGDFNADTREMPVRLLLARVEDTGSEALASRVLVPLEATVDPARRYSVVHEGTGFLLDHLLASTRLARGHRGTTILNDNLEDEWGAAHTAKSVLGSLHAPIVSELQVEPLP